MRETKTVQVYPSDNIVNSTISEYESFGWEVIGNQRCQEYDGQTHGVDGSTTNHYSTFNKITFSREKDTEWYKEVSATEIEYEKVKAEIKLCENRKPILRQVKPEGIVAAALGLWLYLLFIVPGVIFTVVRIVLKLKYKKQYNEALSAYNAVYPARIKELENKQRELRRLAENCVSGKA